MKEAFFFWPWRSVSNRERGRCEQQQQRWMGGVEKEVPETVYDGWTAEEERSGSGGGIFKRKMTQPAAVM